jgi:hypothetical protein
LVIDNATLLDRAPLVQLGRNSIRFLVGPYFSILTLPLSEIVC